MMNELDAQDIWRKDRDHFIHPYTDFSTFKEEGSHIISRAKGAYITDSDGKQIIDGIGGLWCVNIGHGREEMANAIANQVLEMEYYNPFGHTTNAPAAVLAAKLADLAPGSLNHVFYASSGSAANDLSVRLIHYYFNRLGQSRKKKIISRIDGYHGATYLAASLTGIHGTKNHFDHIPDFIEHVSAANMYRRPDGMDEGQFCDYLVREFEDRILQLGPDSVAAFIAEPVMGAGGVLVAPEGYHKRMHAVCKKYDMFYISDEVVTAFGRLGVPFASKSVFDVEPDVINTAKGITSGYIPHSATLLSDEIYDVISAPDPDGGSLTMGYTYSGHPVACAAALKNLEILEREDIYGHVKNIGPKFAEMMQELMSISIVGDVRGYHLMQGVELVSDKETKAGFDADIGSATRVYKKCLEKGVMVRPIGDLLVFSPPLIVTEENCREMVDALKASIEETKVELVSEGLLAAA
jgi:adenosylmethionine-8-amino-7-oxononanoate aminotransferase